MSDAKTRQSARTVAAKRLVVAGSIAFLAVNVWIGAPLLALRVGALAAGEQSLSMRGVCVTVLALATLAYGLAFALTKLSQLYDQLAQRPSRRTPQSWLRSMRAEETSDVETRHDISVPDVILVLNVCIALTSLVAWYALMAGKPFSLVL